MAPKTKYTKEFIVNTALEIARIEGIDHITIRKVAEKMGSSIAPIYVNFTDVEELKKEVLLKIQNISQQMLKTEYSSNPFLNIGIASIKFAKQYPVLFRELVMNNRHLDDLKLDIDDLLKQMRLAPELSELNDEVLMEIMFKMQVFQLGLSVMDVNDMLPEDFTEERMIALLESAGNDVISAARLRKKEL